jgi:hypothetical protein
LGDQRRADCLQFPGIGVLGSASLEVRDGCFGDVGQKGGGGPRREWDVVHKSRNLRMDWSNGFIFRQGFGPGYWDRGRWKWDVGDCFEGGKSALYFLVEGSESESESREMDEEDSLVSLDEAVNSALSSSSSVGRPSRVRPTVFHLVPNGLRGQVGSFDR